MFTLSGRLRPSRAHGPLHWEVGLPRVDQAGSAEQCIVEVVHSEDVTLLDREEKKLP